MSSSFAAQPGRRPIWQEPTAALAALLVLARLVLRAAGPPLSAGGFLTPPFDLLFTALLLVALVWLAIGLIERLAGGAAAPPAADAGLAIHARGR